MTQGIERIPDTLGYLILTEDGAVFGSGGDLENDESTANKVLSLVRTAISATNLNEGSERQAPNFKKLSVVWDSMLYVITVSNHKIFVSKRKNNPIEPVSA